jgi:hypothetical protein
MAGPGPGRSVAVLAATQLAGLLRAGSLPRLRLGAAA